MTSSRMTTRLCPARLPSTWPRVPWSLVARRTRKPSSGRPWRALCSIRPATSGSAPRVRPPTAVTSSGSSSSQNSREIHSRPCGMQAGLAHVDVVVGRGARAEDELPEAHRALEQHPAQLVAVAGLQDGSRVGVRWQDSGGVCPPPPPGVKHRRPGGPRRRGDLDRAFACSLDLPDVTAGSSVPRDAAATPDRGARATSADSRCCSRSCSSRPPRRALDRPVRRPPPRVAGRTVLRRRPRDRAAGARGLARRRRAPRRGARAGGGLRARVPRRGRAADLGRLPFYVAHLPEGLDLESGAGAPAEPAGGAERGAGRRAAGVRGAERLAVERVVVVRAGLRARRARGRGLGREHGRHARWSWRSSTPA